VNKLGSLLDFMMTEISAITTVLRRMFSKKATFKSATRTKPLAGIHKKMKFIEKDESVDNFNAEDISEFETDFMNVNISHKMYKRYVLTFLYIIIFNAGICLYIYIQYIFIYIFKFSFEQVKFNYLQSVQDGSVQISKINICLIFGKSEKESSSIV